VEDYIAAAVRMADSYAERAALYEQLERPECLNALFEGRPECLGERLYQIWSAADEAEAEGALPDRA